MEQPICKTMSTLHTNYPNILDDLSRRMANVSSDSLTSTSTSKSKSTSMASLQELLTAYHNNGRIRSMETKHEETEQLSPFREGGVTDLLVARLLLKDANDNGNGNGNGNNGNKKNDDDTKTQTEFISYLVLTQTLVTSLPAWYLPALSQSVSDAVSLAPQQISLHKLAYRGINDNENGDGNDNDNHSLLKMWVSLLANSSTPLKVHDQLSNALIVALAADADRASASATATPVLSTLRHDASAALVGDWKQHLAAIAGTATSSSSSSGKVASVRCATVWMRMVSSWRPPSDSIANGLAVLLAMLRDGDDPLQQLSLLDSMIQDLDPDDIDGYGNGNGNGNGNFIDNHNHNDDPASNRVAAECWSAPELVEVAVSFLRDPLLSDAALRYLGGLSSSLLSADAHQLMLEHVRGVCDARGGRPPTRDTERLPLVRALFRLASTQSQSQYQSQSQSRPHILDVILGDPVLRSAWWDLSQTSNPKLRAAVLVSVARCLNRLAEHEQPDDSGGASASGAMRLYRYLGPDNTGGNVNSNSNSNAATGTSSTTRWLLDTAASSPISEPRNASHALLAAFLRLPNQNAEVTNELVADPSATLSLVQDVLLSPTHHICGTAPDAQRARFDVLEAFLDHHCGCGSEFGSDNENESLSLSPVLAAACGITPAILRKLRAQRALGPHGKQPLRYGVDDDVA